MTPIMPIMHFIHYTQGRRADAHPAEASREPTPADRGEGLLTEAEETSYDDEETGKERRRQTGEAEPPYLGSSGGGRVRKPDEFLVAADLPGFKKDDVKIEYENGELRFEAHRPDFDDASDKAPGSAPWAHDYRRTFRISSRVDAGAIAAALNRGVLSIHLPKAESEKPRHIAVTVQ